MKGPRPGPLVGGGVGHVVIRTLDPYDSYTKVPSSKDSDTTHYSPGLAGVLKSHRLLYLFAFCPLLSCIEWLFIIAFLDGIGDVIILSQSI